MMNPIQRTLPKVPERSLRAEKTVLLRLWWNKNVKSNPNKNKKLPHKTIFHQMMKIKPQLRSLRKNQQKCSMGKIIKISQRRRIGILLFKTINRNQRNRQKFCRSAPQSTHQSQTVKISSIKKSVSLTNRNHSVANPWTASASSHVFPKSVKKSPKSKRRNQRYSFPSQRCRTRPRGERVSCLRNSLPRKRESWTTTQLGMAKAWTQSS